MIYNKYVLLFIQNIIFSDNVICTDFLIFYIDNCEST